MRRVAIPRRWRQGKAPIEMPRRWSPARELGAPLNRPSTRRPPSARRRSPSRAGPATTPSSQPSLSISRLVGRPSALPARRSVSKASPRRIGVARQRLDADLVEEGLGPIEPGGVDIDRDDLEIGRSRLRLQAVERRHFGAAGHAPGRPEVEARALALEIGERQLAPVRAVEGHWRRRLRALVDTRAPRSRHARAARAARCASAEAAGTIAPRPCPRRRFPV